MSAFSVNTIVPIYRSKIVFCIRAGIQIHLPANSSVIPSPNVSRYNVTMLTSRIQILNKAQSIYHPQEVDLYIENIIAKFGDFRYAEFKTPFNPPIIDEHLPAMIPGLSGANGRRSDTARSDLTLRIVKTADNHLSVVKKGAKDPLPFKRTVDLSKDGNRSRTPTQAKSNALRRGTVDVRAKTTKSSNRQSNVNTPDSYRRQSVAVERLHVKRPETSIGRRSIESANDKKNMSAPTRIPMRESAAANQPASALNVSATSSKTSSRSKQSQNSRKRKGNPNLKSGTSKKQGKFIVDLEEKCENEANILRSVGLVKKVVTENSTTATDVKPSTSSVGRSDATRQPSTSNSNQMDKNARNEGGPTVSRTFMHRPFVEIKEEPLSDLEASETLTSKPTMHSTPLNDSQRTASRTTKDEIKNPKRAYSPHADDDYDEDDDDDDSLMIIEDDEPATSIVTRKRAVRPEGVRYDSIVVRDITKMTRVEENTRNTVPSGSNNGGTSMLKSNNPSTSNKKTTPTNDVASKSIESVQRQSNSNNSSRQPPPLAAMSKSSATSMAKMNTGPNASTTTASQSNQARTPTASPPVASTSTPIFNGISQEMASAIAGVMIGAPPRMTPRPSNSGPNARESIDVGPANRLLTDMSHKLNDFFRSLLEDTISDLAAHNTAAHVATLKLTLEQEQSAREKEVTELKASYDRLLTETRKTYDKERERVIDEVRRQGELERIRAVRETKKTMWCSNCWAESQYLCCWNTSYCTEACQNKHWYVNIFRFQFD